MTSPAGPWPELGSYIWGGHAGPPPYDFRKSSYADTRCHVGAFGRAPPIHPKLRLHAALRVASVHGAAVARVRTEAVDEIRARGLEPRGNVRDVFLLHPRSSQDPRSDLGRGRSDRFRPWIGWITYLPPDLAARAKYPADVEVETLEDGAALVTLCEEPFGKTDAEGLARLHALEAALRPIQS